MVPVITPAQTEVLVQSNPLVQPHGSKGKAIEQLMASTGASRSKVYRMLGQVTVRPQRKPRADKGQVALNLQEAQTISAWLMEGLRKKNTKQLRTVEQALQELRYAGLVRAERVDTATGEVLPLSVSAVARALRAYGLHPDQLLRPAPAVAIQSLHPNHVWEIDASLCVLYYLSNATGASKKASGLQVMDADKFYKNKPKALERIESERVWRYLVVDHYSGALFCHYVMGAESGHNLVEAFIHAVTPRTVAGQTDPFCGVPFMLYMDPGSANTGALLKNLARRLAVRVDWHAPGNARATGGVEKPQDIWECAFESALRSECIGSLDQLNEAACVYSRFFNATRVHTRHGRTRTDMWLTITVEQKRMAPSMDMLRLLATHSPEDRKVEPWPGPVVRFAGKVYDVSKVPNVMIGEKLPITYSPYVQDHACVVCLGSDGNENLVLVPEVQYNEAGFPVKANIFGEGPRQAADTVLQTNRKLVERLAMGAETDEAAAANRKAKVPALGGAVRPLDQARNTVLPTPLPKRGVEVDLHTTTAATEHAVRLLTHFEAMQWLARNGCKLDAAGFARLKADHPMGVPEDALEAIKARAQAIAGSGLQLVAGGAR